MKRFLTGILAVFYLCICTGFTVHEHFCMGRLVEASFTHPDSEEHQCSNCGMEKKSDGKGCCKEEHRVVKADVEHVGAKAVSLPMAQLLISDVPPAHFAFAPWTVAALNVLGVPTANAPPKLLQQCPLFIRHCSFLI